MTCSDDLKGNLCGGWIEGWVSMPQALLWVLRGDTMRQRPPGRREDAATLQVERLTKAGVLCPLQSVRALQAGGRSTAWRGLGARVRQQVGASAGWIKALASPRPARSHHARSTAGELPSVSGRAHHGAPVFSESFLLWIWSSWPAGPTWFTSTE